MDGLESVGVRPGGGKEVWMREKLICRKRERTGRERRRRGRLPGLLVALVMVLLVLALPVSVRAEENADDADEGYRILSDAFSATVSQDGTVLVSEKVRVQFDTPLHGIYRKIPTEFSVDSDLVDGVEDTYTYHTRISDVKVSGGEAKVSKDDEGETQIRIGSKKKTISGKKTYTIRYTVQLPWDRTREMDFLYYDILPRWTVPVEKFTWSMKFEEPVDEESLEAMQVFSGPAGETRNLLKITPVLQKNGISGSVSDIPAGYAATIFVPLPEGYFSVRLHSRVPALLFLGLTLLFSAASLAAVIASLLLRGRTETAEFPPDGLSPADAGRILLGRESDRQLLSLIPYWAQKGYVSICLSEDDPESVTVQRVCELPGTAEEEEKLLFDHLFAGGPEWRSREDGQPLKEGMKEAGRALDRKYAKERSLSKLTGLCDLLRFAPLVCACLLITQNYLSDRDGLLIMALVAGVCGLLILYWSWRIREESGWGRGLRIAGMLVGSLFLGIWLAGSYAPGDSAVSGSLMDLCALLLILACCLSGQLYFSTAYRRQYLGRLKGLRRYLTHGDGSKQDSGERSQEYYALLPYALAFGVEKQWAKQFGKTSLDPPAWLLPPAGGWSSVERPYTVYEMNRYMTSGLYRSSSDGGSSSDSSGSGGSSGGGAGGGSGGAW